MLKVRLPAFALATRANSWQPLFDCFIESVVSFKFVQGYIGSYDA